MLTNTIHSELTRLISLQNQLQEAILFEGHSFWMPDINPEDDDKKGFFLDAKSHNTEVTWLVNAITQLDYIDGQDGRATQKQKGVILVGPSSLQLAALVNESKNTLAGLFAALSATLPKKRTTKQHINETSSIRELLSFHSLGRLSLKQTVRNIPIIDRAPARISWLERRSNSIVRLTLDEAEKKLKALTSMQAQIDLEKLGRLPRSEVLAVVQQPNNPTLKATVFFKQSVNGLMTTVRHPIHAPVPILCATGNVLPALAKGGNRKYTPRSDRKIESMPYLQSIKAHRYIQQP